jgi:hypothetical protein
VFHDPTWGTMVRAAPRLAVIVLGAASLARCAAPGVTLHSNHYRLPVPPEWQVVEPGGDGVLPTVLRAPSPAGGAGPVVEVRVYTWTAQGPLADPSGDARERLAAAGVPGFASAKADDVCPDSIREVAVFGLPARAFHPDAGAGQRLVLAAGHAAGSLVAIVGIASVTPSPCADVRAVDSALARVAADMTSAADVTRPVPRSTVLEAPRGGRTIEIPAADPSAPSP